MSRSASARARAPVEGVGDAQPGRRLGGRVDAEQLGQVGAADVHGGVVGVLDRCSGAQCGGQHVAGEPGRARAGEPEPATGWNVDGVFGAVGVVTDGQHPRRVGPHRNRSTIGWLSGERRFGLGVVGGAAPVGGEPDPAQGPGRLTGGGGLGCGGLVEAAVHASAQLDDGQRGGDRGGCGEAGVSAGR